MQSAKRHGLVLHAQGMRVVGGERSADSSASATAMQTRMRRHRLGAAIYLRCFVMRLGAASCASGAALRLRLEEANDWAAMAGVMA